MNFSWNIPENQKSDDNLPSIIFAHGFGANGSDLEALRFELDVSAKWFFPQAPVQIQPGSYAWFPSDPVEMETALQGRYFRNLADFFPFRAGRTGKSLGLRCPGAWH